MNTHDKKEPAMPEYQWTPENVEWPAYTETDENQYRREPDAVSTAAAVVFGIQNLFPWQRLVIANILDAAEAARTPVAEKPGFRPQSEPEEIEDCIDEDGILRGKQIVLLPTGAGKSLCFQIPALFLDGPTLVVYPLLALMNDQLRRIQNASTFPSEYNQDPEMQTALSVPGMPPPAIFRGGQTTEERMAQYHRLDGSDGQPPAKLIIVNPEILSVKNVLERIASRPIAHLVIDEAHCVSEWGDSFRPSYLELAKVIQKLKTPVVTAFTATASPAVLDRIAEILFSGKAHIVRGESDRPNIRYSVYRCTAKNPALIREVSRHARPMVIFCSTRNGAERTAHLLRTTFNDTDIRFYHAGLQPDEKIKIETWFHSHKRAILCATCAWGMGVDKSDVRTVIHRDAPPTAEAYVQEAGRAGRDGHRSEAILLWSDADKIRIQHMPEQQKIRAQVLIRFAESGECRRKILLETLGDPRVSEDAPGGKELACSGCDICDGTALPYVADAELVCNYLKKNPRCFSSEELAGNLCECGNRISMKKNGYAEWSPADFVNIIQILNRQGLIRQLHHGPWKGKLTISPEQHRRQIRFPPVYSLPHRFPHQPVVVQQQEQLSGEFFSDAAVVSDN